MALLAPCRSVLQEMIDIAVAFCRKNCLSFNTKKTKVLVFGKHYDRIDEFCPLKINGDEVDYAEAWKYLGFHLKSGKKCSFCPEGELRSFHRSSNCILRSLKRPNEAVLMHLLYSNCVSILTHGSAVKEFSQRDFMKCNTAVNNAIRLIFSYRRWESIRVLREQFGYESLTELFEKSRTRFEKSLSCSTNPILRHIHDHC